MTEMTEMTVSTEATDISTESSSPAESSVAIETNAGPAVGGGPAAAVEGLLEGGGPVAAVHEEEDLLESLGVQGEMKNLVDIDDDEGLKPLSGSAVAQMLLPESDRVMQEQVEYIEEDNQAREFVPNFVMPVAERVREEPVVVVIPEAQRVVDTQNVSEQPGGDGKVKMDLNLKELAGNPSDEAVGAAAVGLMAQAVKAKGPDETQVNALTGFSHQIMNLISELENED